MLKKILLKVSFIVILLIIINFIYSRWFYESDIQKYSDIIDFVRDVPDDADIIYVGESSNTTFRENDLDKRKISEFIGDYFPGLNTYDISKPASHAGIYKVLLENIPKANKVKTIIVTLNLRSFNAQWIYSDLETPLQRSLVLLRPYPPLVNRFLLSFKAYDIKTIKERGEEIDKKWLKDEFHMPGDFQFKNVVEWDRWMANSGKFDQANIELACHYIKGYAFQIDMKNNPRIKDFNDIIALAKKRNWNIVFNLMAENTEKAEELVGDDLIFMMNENAEKLTKYFEEKGVLVVNNLNAVESDQFVDQDWTTEHYAEKGRKTIAKNVVEAMVKWHEDDFEEVKYTDNYQTHFFNNCDEGLTWGQMHTLTSEKAHSGDKSSMTGDGNDFSMTLEYPLNVIPDSLLNTLNIDLWLYQTALDHDAKLVVEAKGEGMEYYWNGFSIKDFGNEINTWVNIKKSISIPGSIKQADLIKIYLYNPSKTKIYIDDFKVDIEE